MAKRFIGPRGRQAVLIIEQPHKDRPGVCWEFGLGTRKRNWAAHLAFGGPVWWKPTVGRKQYSGITEWRAGWLLIAVQLAVRPQIR